MSKFKTTNILLINPWIYDFAAYDLWVKPLGLLYLAGLLRENNYQVYLLDCLNVYHPKMKEVAKRKLPKRRKYGCGQFYKEIIAKPRLLQGIPRRYGRYGLTPEIFREELLNLPQPEIILVTSAMTYWYPGVFEVIRIAKEVYPSIPLILGGIYATLCSDHAKAFSGADYVIAGEGEIKTLKLIAKLTGNRLVYLPELQDLDSYPYPAFDLLHRLEYVCLLTSRGCPFKCIYCASPNLSFSFRQRNPSKIVQEIEYWWKVYGVKDFVFYDDALLFHSEVHIIPLLKKVISRDIRVNFHTPNGLNVRGITPEVAKLIYQAGFKTIRLGLETVNRERQFATGGKVRTEEFEGAMAYLREAGFSPETIGVYLLAGLPDQRAEEIEESLRFVQRFGAKPMITEYSPLPGTSLWKEAVKVSKFDLASDPLFHNNSIFPCQWEGFTVEMLNQLKILAKGPPYSKQSY